MGNMFEDWYCNQQVDKDVYDILDGVWKGYCKLEGNICLVFYC